MADRSAAAVFAYVFECYARAKSPEVLKLALETWRHVEEFDFSPDQMNCDKALIKLRLAKRGVDPAYPDDGVTVVYADLGGRLPNTESD